MSKVVDLLGDKTSYYLDHTCKTIDKSLIYIPSPDTIDKVWIDLEDRSEVGESCAEIVNGDLDAELADLVQEVYHFIEIPDLFRFQNLKGDSLTRPGRQIAEQVV